MSFPWEDVIKILAAAIGGGLLGIEREYRSKPAGLRTLIMITVGSTLFSILSLSVVSQSPDRIASNIVTGVGFVGGGVIFKEGVNVRGVTTAATIWTASAIGMAIGFGQYWTAVITLAIVLITLTVLSRFEKKFDITDPHNLQVMFSINEYSLQQLEQDLKNMHIHFKRIHLTRDGVLVKATFRLEITDQKLEELTTFLVNTPAVKAFEK